MLKNDNYYFLNELNVVMLKLIFTAQLFLSFFKFSCSQFLMPLSTI